MQVTVHNTSCHGCGNRLDIGAKKCEFCDSPVHISTFNSVNDMPMPMVNKYAASYRAALLQDPGAGDLYFNMAMCYLKLKLYDKALDAFENAMANHFDNVETYFYAAICLLDGKKAFVAPRANIDKAKSYLESALMIESRGIFHYLLAYIKYDYFERKYLNISPNWKDCYHEANQAGVSVLDITQLYSILGVSRPDVL